MGGSNLLSLTSVEPSYPHIEETLSGIVDRANRSWGSDLHFYRLATKGVSSRGKQSTPMIAVFEITRPQSFMRKLFDDINTVKIVVIGYRALGCLDASAHYLKNSELISIKSAERFDVADVHLFPVRIQNELFTEEMANHFGLRYRPLTPP